MLKDRLSATHSDKAAAGARLAALEEVEELLRSQPQASSLIQPLIVEARQKAELASTGDQQAAEMFAAAHRRRTNGQ